MLSIVLVSALVLLGLASASSSQNELFGNAYAEAIEQAMEREESELIDAFRTNDAAVRAAREIREMLAAEAAATAEEALLRGTPARGRGRRDGDAPFRKCGAQLLQHIMDEKLCSCGRKKRSVFEEEPVQEASELFKSRSRRGADQKKISDLCCINMCRPSEVKALCCSR